MALSAQAALWISIAGQTGHFWALSALCFSGGVIAWPFALFAVRLTVPDRSAEVVFGAALVFLSVSTISVTAGIFAILYRAYYAQWHGDPFTWLWVIQFVFTTASALYQFAVIGLRLYLPVGFIFLLLAAFLLARHHPRSRHLSTA